MSKQETFQEDAYRPLVDRIPKYRMYRDGGVSTHPLPPVNRHTHYLLATSFAGGKKFGSISPFCGTTDIPVLDFG